MTEVQPFPTDAFVAGAWRATARRFPVTNPATGEVLAEVADCDVEEARTAADAASEAFRTWSRLGHDERAKVLRRFAALLRERAADAGRLVSLEMGRPISQAGGEAHWAAGIIEDAVAEAGRLGGETMPARSPLERTLVIRQPVGPVLAITPWNYPLLLAGWKLGPALAVGCTVLHKPAEQSPLSALFLARLWEEAGGPAGVYQVLPCSDPAPVADTLLDDERVRKLAFTGSTATGRLLYERAARTFKRVTLECGGNSPVLVFDDADLDAAAAWLRGNKYHNAGQICLSANRVYVQGRLGDELAGRVAALAAKVKVGDPLDPATDMGPLTDARGLEKVRAHVADALERGARLVTGGSSPGGLFFEATVLAGVRSGSRLLEEETFGPVVALSGFADEEEAVKVANDTSAGLAAHVWTRDLGRAWRVAERLEAGTVTVNGAPAITGHGPFGGWKASGLGRENGRWGLDGYLETKTISLKLG